MADFNKAIEIVLKHEGGYVDNKSDSGGPTKYGLSLKFLKSIDYDFSNMEHDHFVDAADIKEMNVEEAKQIYKNYIWDKNNYELIHDQDLATKVFDMATNIGTKTANQFLQLSAQEISDTCHPVADGELGNHSITIINHCPANRIIKKFISYCLFHYESLVKHNPHLAIFLEGWINRAKSI